MRTANCYHISLWGKHLLGEQGVEGSTPSCVNPHLVFEMPPATIGWRIRFLPGKGGAAGKPAVADGDANRHLDNFKDTDSDPNDSDFTGLYPL